MRRSCNTLIFAWAALLGIGTPHIVHSAPTTNREIEERAVRAASRDIQLAARCGDVTKLQKMLTPEGEYVDSTGRVTKINDVINGLAVKLPSDTLPVAEPEANFTLRFVTDEVAIEKIATNVVNPANHELISRRLTLMWVKRDGQWLLDTLQDTLADASPINAQLKPLDWLLGEWVSKDDGTSVLISSKWSDDGNYILRDLMFRHNGGETVFATQRIGWDPVTRQIKAWAFDSQGGRGEEVWHREGQRWLVETVDVSPDGQQGKTMALYTPEGNHRYTWEVKSAEVAGMKLKPKAIEFRRAAEDK